MSKKKGKKYQCFNFLTDFCLQADRIELCVVFQNLLLVFGPF